MNTPVLFLIYNRPLHTEKVFAQIRKAKPEFLFVAADGPKQSEEGDEEKCELARSVIHNIDWKCEVKLFFRDENVGTKIAVSSAINWFFENAEEGIILEDDCLPDISFFSFASSLLEYYRDDETIMHINGTNYLKGKKIIRNGSYYFSNVCHPWGWATWKRSWGKYDIEMQGIEDFILSDSLSFLCKDKRIIKQWAESLMSAHSGKIRTWDYQWFYSVWKNKGWAITPAQNLVTNIGFGPDGTFTKYKSTHIGNMKSFHIKEFIHPYEKLICYTADEFSLKLRYREANPNFIDKVNYKLNLIFTN